LCGFSVMPLYLPASDQVECLGYDELTWDWIEVGQPKVPGFVVGALDTGWSSRTTSSIRWPRQWRLRKMGDRVGV